jgi:hypothetical protein
MQHDQAKDFAHGDEMFSVKHGLVEAYKQASCEYKEFEQECLFHAAKCNIKSLRTVKGD